MLAIPRCGERTYRLADYTTSGSAGSFAAVELVLGHTRLLADDRGLILQGETWTILGDGLSAIGRELTLRRPDVPTVDVLSTWELAIANMFAMLGPMRSAALIWKIYGSANGRQGRSGDADPKEDLGGAIVETQQGEAHAFSILAGWFPGLCKYIPPTPPRLTQPDVQEGGLGSIRETLEIHRGPELYSVLSAYLAGIGWLPEAPIQIQAAGAPEAHEYPTSTLGRVVRLGSAGVTGHHRWLCVEPIDAGTISQDDTTACALSLALRRGIRNPRTLVLRNPRPGDVRALALFHVGLGIAPLAVGLVADSVSEDVMQEIRQYLFPYAATILAIGPGLRPRMDPRCDPEQSGSLPPAFSGWPPFTTEYTYRPFAPEHVGGGTLVIAAPETARQLATAGGAHIYALTSACRYLVAPDDVGAEVFESLKIDAKERLAQVRIVVVIRDSRWRPVLRKFMHIIREPFVLKFHS
jgi:hypothetical protein